MERMFNRSRNAVAGATPCSSWSIDRIRPSMNAVVAGEREPGGELDRAEDAQAAVGERRRIDDAQHAPLEIGAAAEWVEVLLGQRVEGDRVDGEIAPACRFFDRHVGVAGDDEPTVA